VPPVVVSRVGRLIALAALLLLLLVVAGRLDAKTRAAPAPPSGRTLAQLARPAAPAPLARQRIYYVLTDRYANGDPANDRGGLTGPNSVTGFEPGDPRYFHGGDFRGLTGTCTDPVRGLARVKDLGFTAVWVSPPFAQRTIQRDATGYHGSWVRDFTTVDPHFGTDADFAAFVSCAHRLKLKVFIGAVVNATADYITLTGTYTSAPYRDCSGRTFDPARYVLGGFPCLRAADMPRQPSLAADARVKKPAWLNDVTRYHDRGDIPARCSARCVEQGDVSGLDDLFTEQPAVWRGLASIYAQWVRRYKLDGLAVADVQNLNAAFFGLWGGKLRTAATAGGIRNFELLGEADVLDTLQLSSFVRDRRLPSVFDGPLQDAVTRYVSGAGSPRRVLARLKADDYFEHSTLPTFLGNTDTGRAAQVIKARSAPSLSAEGLLRRVLLGYDLLYLLRGAPVVSYGDEVGIAGLGAADTIRQDMFPTKVPYWKTEERVGSGPIGNASSFDQGAHPIAQRLRALAKLRDDVPALATGATFARLAEGGVLAVSRIDARDRREYLTLCNASTIATAVEVPTSTPVSTWTAVLGTGTATTTGRGVMSITVPAVSTLVLRAGQHLPVRPPVVRKLTVASDAATGLWEVTAGTGASGPVSVAFAFRRAGHRTWVRFAADDSPPYRSFLARSRVRRGERVYVVAVARSPEGKVAVSGVKTLAPR
jgi:glycosidase